MSMLVVSAVVEITPSLSVTVSANVRVVFVSTDGAVNDGVAVSAPSNVTTGLPFICVQL